MPDLSDDFFIFSSNFFLKRLEKITALIVEVLRVSQNMCALVRELKQFAAILVDGERTIDELL